MPDVLIVAIISIFLLILLLYMSPALSYDPALNPNLHLTLTGL